MRNLKLTLVLLGFSLLIQGQEPPTTYQNPVLPGYHPDPSICRVGDDYYLVNSTFIWYPGIPIYHSKDLINWKIIGHGIHRPDQINLDGLVDNYGIFAVTIRHHEGTFYLITTCVQCGMNFYLTSTDPSGPWSDPIWLEEAPGIDPSLMWDDDGICYYTGHTQMPNPRYPGDKGIWNQELDLTQQKLVGPRKILTRGHAHNALWTEGPHLYKIDGKYLLLVSEGGTDRYHAITVHHSDSVWGPYQTDPINPVITHRHLGEKYWLQATGHGDLVQTQNGEWWCVMLGKRLVDGEVPLGRETFMAQVEFQDGTPIFNPGHGVVLKEQVRPDLPWSPFEPQPARDGFEGDKLDLKWCTMRVPKEQFYEVNDGKVNLYLRPLTADSLVNSSLLVQRIEHHQFNAITKLHFKTKRENEQAGLIIYRTNENHYLLMKERNDLVLIKKFQGEKSEIARVPYDEETVYLKAKGNNLDVKFSFGESPDQFKPIGQTQSLVVISEGYGNKFNGPGIGMYATSNGKKTRNQATFDWFEYNGLK